MARGTREPWHSINGMDGVTLGDFWAWAYSDILSNRNRAVFAEFIVGSALGVVEGPRVEWDAVDLRYRGRAIEVKSAAYVQSWAQARPSVITFDVARKRGWDAETNTSLPNADRSADYLSYLNTTLEVISRIDMRHLVNQHFPHQRASKADMVHGFITPIPIFETTSSGSNAKRGTEECR